MMAAYQPTPGVGHPGLPHGHPGMAPNPGQHMGQPMQMHPGVSGAPQQANMMGMQPGAMGAQHPGAGMAMSAHMGGQSMAGGIPNAQAMSHLTPQQMQQQQQAHLAAMQSNPQLAMQHHQMRMRQQQMMAAQANGMMGNMPQGMPMNPQLVQQMQQQQQQQQQHQQGQPGVQGGGQQVQLTPHLQQQQMIMQQQRQQQIVQAQQQNQMAQLAMQQQHSQQSNQGQPQPPNPQGTPASAAAQQMRPQSRMANPNEAAQATQQQHPQHSQSQQGQPQPQPGQTQQGQAAAPNQQQTQQMTMQQRQQLAMIQRQQVLQARQMSANQQGQQPAAQGGMFILRLMNFSDHLSNFTANSDSPAYGRNVAHWHNFVDKHFAPEGRLIHSFENADPNGRGKQFEVLRPNVARYFYTYFDSGANTLRLHTEHAREVPHPAGTHQVTCQNAIFSVSYPNGARLEMSGSLHVLFAPNSDSIEVLQFSTTNTEEIVSRQQIEKAISDFSPTMSTKASPKMAKNKLPKAQQKLLEAENNRLTIDHIPKTPKGTMGFTSKVQQFLEIGETMNVMSDLMHYAQEKKMRPDQALEAWVLSYESPQNGQPQQNGNPQLNLPPNGIPAGSTTPNMRNMQMPQNGQHGNFSSPSMVNMSIPMNGSPHLGNHPGNLGVNMTNSHTPSPHQSAMSAPMMAQHSQQGTNSSVASENPSPNVNTNNKRRRSTVKLEGDDGGGAEVNNANRVKPSPRMSKKSKP